nr:MAG TPA: hypothetical protein [Caudoviricetes sp.]
MEHNLIHYSTNSSISQKNFREFISNFAFKL